MERRWHPAPRELIRKAGKHRRSRDNPADEVVGYLWVWHLFDEGEKPTRRELARDLGWTEHRARGMLETVRASFTEWRVLTATNRPAAAESRPWAAQSRPQYPNNGGTMSDESAHKSPQVARGSPPTRARFTITHTEQDKDTMTAAVAGRLESDPSDSMDRSHPDPESSAEVSGAPVQSGPRRRKAPAPPSPGVDLAGLWERLEDIRLAVETNGRRSILGARRSVLRARVTEHGEEALELAWRWWWNADTDRARFLRSGYRYKTFFRPANLREYVEFAREWNEQKASSTTDLFALGPDSFDEDGNLIADGINR